MLRRAATAWRTQGFGTCCLRSASDSTYAQRDSALPRARGGSVARAVCSWLAAILAWQTQKSDGYGHRPLVASANLVPPSRCPHHSRTLMGWCPHMRRFVTFSSADLFWPELFKVLKPGVDPATLSAEERGQLLADNPIAAADFFHRRWTSFYKHVLCTQPAARTTRASTSQSARAHRRSGEPVGTHHGLLLAHRVSSQVRRRSCGERASHTRAHG